MTCWPSASVTTAVKAEVPAVVGEPVMAPLEGPMGPSPAGRLAPLVDQ